MQALIRVEASYLGGQDSGYIGPYNHPELTISQASKFKFNLVN